jgi:hypothetical protein
MTKFVLEVETTRIVCQLPVVESTLLPIIAFGWVADSISELPAGMKIVIGCRLSGTEFRPAGGEIRRGVQIVAEIVAVPARRKTLETEHLAK